MDSNRVTFSTYLLKDELDFAAGTSVQKRTLVPAGLLRRSLFRTSTTRKCLSVTKLRDHSVISCTQRLNFFVVKRQSMIKICLPTSLQHKTHRLTMYWNQWFVSFCEMWPSIRPWLEPRRTIPNPKVENKKIWTRTKSVEVDLTVLVQA